MTNRVKTTRPAPTPKQRLEYLRSELRAERISYDELHELQNLAPHIEPGDVELLEAAGVPEFPDTNGHTPGPWESKGSAGYTGHRVIDSAGRSLAAFPSTMTRPREERDANAALIAAATDLLEACQMAIWYYRTFRDNSPIGATERDDIASIEAAIAKATGAT
jgi:hypothetical protein